MTTDSGRDPAGQPLLASLPEPASGFGPTGDDPSREGDWVDMPWDDPRRVFVFGSNLAGRHGKGAALYARKNRGAIYGQAEGLQGNSYAIPTKDSSLRTLPLSTISEHARTFIAFARMRPELRFQLTAIGCGLAGYRPWDIAPMFEQAPATVELPVEFKEALLGHVITRALDGAAQ